MLSYSPFPSLIHLFSKDYKVSDLRSINTSNSHPLSLSSMAWHRKASSNEVVECSRKWKELEESFLFCVTHDWIFESRAHCGPTFCRGLVKFLFVFTLKAFPSLCFIHSIQDEKWNYWQPLSRTQNSLSFLKTKCFWVKTPHAWLSPTPSSSPSLPICVHLSSSATLKFQLGFK